jgi:hypothetical protein
LTKCVGDYFDETVSISCRHGKNYSAKDRPVRIPHPSAKDLKAADDLVDTYNTVGRTDVDFVPAYRLHVFPRCNDEIPAMALDDDSRQKAWQGCRFIVPVTVE